LHGWIEAMQGGLHRLFLHPLPGFTGAAQACMNMAAQVRIAWPPGKLVARTRSVGNQNRRIAGTGRTHRHRNVAAGHIADAGDELAHRPASAGAEIERRALCTIEQRAYPIDARIRQIGHMDVVAYTGAVVAENREAFAFSRGRLEQQRNRMGFRNLALADLALRICRAALK